MNRAKWVILGVAALLLALAITPVVAAQCSCGGRTSASGGGAVGELDNGVVRDDCCQPATTQCTFCEVHGYVPSVTKLQVVLTRDSNALFDELRTQHRLIMTLMDQIMRAPAAARPDLYNQFRLALIPHMEAEEATFYAALEQTRAGHMSALTAQEQHHTAASVLGELDTTPVGSDRWMARFVVLRDGLVRHIGGEETIVFSDASRALSPAELATLYMQFNTQEQHMAALLKPLAINTSLSGPSSDQGMSSATPYEFNNPVYNAMQHCVGGYCTFDQHLQNGRTSNLDGSMR